VLGYLGGHNIAVIPLGNGNEGISFFYAGFFKDILIESVAEQRFAFEFGRESAEAIDIGV
jgi:hypothetical protein